MLPIALLILFGSSKKENLAQLESSNSELSDIELEWLRNIVVVIVS